MNLVIIRTYPLDDWRAYNCFQSFKKVLDADYIFFAQSSEDIPKGSYNWITSIVGAKILIRPYCCNFGGRDNVRACIEGLKMIDTSKYERIIFSDADIVVHKNPLDSNFDFGGICHTGNEFHYSGQMLLFSRDVFDFVVNYPNYEWLYEDFITTGKSISDDTIFSWIVLNFYPKGIRVKDFYQMGYWDHTKLHHLEPK